MIPTAILATLLFATPIDCLEYLDIRATNRPAAAAHSRLSTSLAVITISGAKVALKCDGKEYRAVLLKY